MKICKAVSDGRRSVFILSHYVIREQKINYFKIGLHYRTVMEPWLLERGNNKQEVKKGKAHSFATDQKHFQSFPFYILLHLDSFSFLYLHFWYKTFA